MKKILVINNDYHVSQNAIKLALEMALEEKARLFGLFVASLKYKEKLSNYINDHQNAIVIMGAFGRSSLSRFFKESLANIILKKTNAPLFIAHD